MRFRITVELTGNHNILPLNYQYEQSAWVYKTIHYGDPLFSEWLHNTGYTLGNKQFRLFCFSPIIPEKYNIVGDRIELYGRKAEINISFYIPEAAEPFIVGIFRNQEFTIGDFISKVQFKVLNIEKLSELNWGSTLKFRTKSPVVISHSPNEKSDESIGGDNYTKYAQYLSPESPGFEQLFINNLVTKYEAVNNQNFNNIIEQVKKMGSFKLLSKPKSKLIRIKSGTRQETAIRGFLFEFEVIAPIELLKVGYYAGFGEKNSLGFGYVEVKG